MDSTATIRRSLAARAVLCLLLSLCGGCVATSMTAPRARVPVLVGPVACIGCPAAPSPEAVAVAPISDSSNRSGGYIVLPKIGQVDYFGDRFPDIDVKADAAISDVCKGDVRISRIQARSFGVVALVYANSEERVEVTGSIVPVANGSCGPRPWPYAGPQGIVWFDQGGAPVRSP